MLKTRTSESIKLALLADQEIALRKKLKKAKEIGDADNVNKYEFHLKCTNIGVKHNTPESSF